MSRTLLINAAEPEERRAALLEDGRLSLLWIERTDERTLVGNVYKGRVVRAERAIGAAFVEVGLERAGFLHVDDVVQQMPDDDDDDAGVERSDVRIDEVLKDGDEVIVQVARDPIAHKGATLTARLSFPGRTVVLLPGLGRVAVSRKIEDDEERRRLRDLVESAGLPEGCGVVVRTAALRASDEAILGEVEELVTRVRAMNHRIAETAVPALVHEETGFAARAIRELLVRAPEGARGPVVVVADTAAATEEAQAAIADAELSVEVREHRTEAPLFHTFGIETEVRQLASPRVSLPGGASLVIQETEALWAIDVNSGRRRRAANLEETALETDLLAAEEVARQIRLRDLAGLIVVDFIDCREPENREKVETAFRRALAKDPARMRVAAMSEFMVGEITRRRSRTGAGRAGSLRCPCCEGTGRVRTPAAAALAAVRDVRRLIADARPARVEVSCAPAVADQLERREESLNALEERHGVAIDVVEDPALGQDGFEVTAHRE